MAGRADNTISSEGALHPLDHSPLPIGRVANPMALHPIPGPPVSNLPPPLIEQSKFDELLGAEEGDFTDKIIDSDFPEDWEVDDIHEEFDENGWNLLHYSVLKGFSNAVQVLVEDLDFDINAKTKVGNMTPLKLVLEKCCDCIVKETNMEPFHDVAVTLMKSKKAAEGADRSVLRLAVNFPVILKGILIHHQDFYQHIDGMPSALTEGIKGLVGENYKMGFIELVLRQNADSIVEDLINYDPEYVKTYTNTSGETPLHTAAKLGNEKIAEQLMKSSSRLGEHMHKQPDRNHFTPIITAAVYYKDHKDSAVNVITEILSHLYTQSRHAAKCIAAIKYTYRGLPVIEYDIKSKEGAIVRGIMRLNKDACEEILCSESYVLGNVHVNIFHLAARYGFPLKIFKDEDDGGKFKLEYLGGQGDDDYDGEDLPVTVAKAAIPTAKPWPCDYAVEYDHVEFLHEAWDFGREEWSHEIKTACRFGNLDAFVFLAAKTKTILDADKYRKLLRLACKHGRASIVEYFLETIGVSPDRQPSEEEKKKSTALMLAADSDAADCVKLLLDHNAKVNDIDQRGYNALCRAILIGKKKAVMAILTHPEHGKTALKFCTERTEKTKPNITPMRLLVKHMIDVAKWVLNEQIVRNPSTGEIVYKYGLIDDFDPDNCDFAGPLFYLKDVVKPRRNRDDADAPCPVNAGNGSYNNLGDSDSDRSYVGDPKPTEYEAYNHMLRLMVKSKSLDILDHILVGRVINHYWKYVIWQWVILRSIYLFITVMLTAFTLVLPHPNDEICRTSEGGIGGGRRAFLIFSSIILILSALLSMLVSGYTVYVAKLTVVKQTRFRVLFEALLPFLILLFVIGYGNDEWCSQRWQWNVGAFCTCLSWLTLLETLKGFRLTAEPINMLFHIIKNFMRLLHLPILLIAAFALPFYMLFTVPGEEHGPYRDIGSTLGTVTILFTGEGDYEGQFNSDQPVSFPFAAYFIYFLFVIMVGILFNNLLISLAVGEVEDLQTNAKLEQHRLNVEGIIDGLEIFFPFIQPKPTDRFRPPRGIEHDERYLEAESEWKIAQEENSEFASSILQDTSDEIIQNKIDQLEATLLEKTALLQQQIQELAEKFNN